MSAGLSLGQCGPLIELEGGIVVDFSRIVDNPAVTMVGVLIDAQVSHQNDVVANVITQIRQGALDDAIWIPSLGANGILASRYSKEHHSRHTKVSEDLDLRL